MGKEGLAMRKPFGFDEKLAESGMCAIGTVRREGELEISGQLQTARFARRVNQTYAPDFGVVFCGNNYFCKGLTRPTSPPEFCFVRREAPRVTTLGTSHRLMGVAPDRAAFQLPDVTNLTRHITGRVGAPARHVHVQPTQVAAARIRHHDGTGSVGEELNAR
jgi:hypothetical protein